MSKVWGKVSQECTVILEMLNFLRTVYRIDRLKEAPVPKKPALFIQSFRYNAGL